MDFLPTLLINIVKVLKYALLIRILMSWIRPHGGAGSFGRIVHQITEPILKPIRNLLPRTGMIDFSPLLTFFLLDFIQIAIIRGIS